MVTALTGGRAKTAFVLRRLGEVEFGVRVEREDVAAEFAKLYEGNRQQPTGRTPVRVEVRRTGRNALGRPRFRVFAEGEPVGRPLTVRRVLPFLEWGINYGVLRRRCDFLQVHAAAFERNSQGIILCAPSGSGKSTLAAALLARGWNYLSDEFALIHPHTHRLHSFPRALCIKASGFPVVKRLGLRFAGRGHYVKANKGVVRYLNPFVNGSVFDGSAPIGHVFYPTYVPGCKPSLRLISQSAATFGLLRNVLNGSGFGAGATGVLAEVTRRAKCWTLHSADIDATCEVLEQAVGGEG